MSLGLDGVMVDSSVAVVTAQKIISIFEAGVIPWFVIRLFDSTGKTATCKKMLLLLYLGGYTEPNAILHKLDTYLQEVSVPLVVRKKKQTIVSKLLIDNFREIKQLVQTKP